MTDTNLLLESIRKTMVSKKKEAERIINEASIEFLRTHDYSILYEASRKAQNLKDSAINDALNMGEIALGELRKTLNLLEDTIDEYQKSIVELCGKQIMVDNLKGPDSDMSKEIMNHINTLEENLVEMYSDREDIINRIQETEQMMEKL